MKSARKPRYVSFKRGKRLFRVVVKAVEAKVARIKKERGE